MKALIAIAVGGGAGSVCRYGATLWALRMFGPRFAFGTLAVNVVGCFALGFLLHVLAESEAASRALRLGLTTGFLGGFTTYSTFGYETLRYWETGQTSLAAANVIANVVLGLLATWGGLVVGRAAF
jgi:CrcB protein